MNIIYKNLYIYIFDILIFNLIFLKVIKQLLIKFIKLFVVLIKFIK